MKKYIVAVLALASAFGIDGIANAGEVKHQGLARGGGTVVGDGHVLDSRMFTIKDFRLVQVDLFRVVEGP